MNDTYEEYYEPQFLPCINSEIYCDYYVYFSRHRDSSILEEVNYQSALDAIGGPSETVIEVRERDWGFGWIEWIAIHKSDIKALKIADEVMAAYLDYPVIDEERYSRAQHEAIIEAWGDSPSRERIEWCRKAGISIFSARYNEIPHEVYQIMLDSEHFR